MILDGAKGKEIPTKEIIVLALIVIPVYRYFTAKKKFVSENDVNIVRTRKPNEGITPIQKKPNVSVSRKQNAILCSNYRSVQQGKNTVIPQFGIRIVHKKVGSFTNILYLYR